MTDVVFDVEMNSLFESTFLNVRITKTAILWIVDRLHCNNLEYDLEQSVECNLSNEREAIELFSVSFLVFVLI